LNIEEKVVEKLPEVEVVEVYPSVEANESDVEVDDYKELELEMLVSTRDNFLVWKDYNY